KRTAAKSPATSAKRSPAKAANGAATKTAKAPAKAAKAATATKTRTAPKSPAAKAAPARGRPKKATSKGAADVEATTAGLETDEQIEDLDGDAELDSGPGEDIELDAEDLNLEDLEDEAPDDGDVVAAPDTDEEVAKT